MLINNRKSASFGENYDSKILKCHFQLLRKSQYLERSENRLQFADICYKHRKTCLIQNLK